jgi:signal transduction histidine kinase
MWKNIRRVLGEPVQHDPLIEFEDGLLLIVDAEQLTTNLCSKLKQFIEVEDTLVYLADTSGASRGFVPVDPGAEHSRGLPDIPTDGKMANWFRANRDILPLDGDSPVIEYLYEELEPFLSRGMGLVFPLISMERLIGLVFLRLEQAAMNKSQLVNLEVLSRQAGLAFENALLFKERLRQNERMYRAEQLATMGQFAAGIAHELRNPLTAIRSTIQFLSGEFDEGSENRRLARGILDEVDRLNNIVGNLLSLAHPSENRPVQIDLRQEIEKCASFTEAKARSQNVELQVTCEDGLPNLLFDPAELRQVLLNIMMNGLQAMPQGGTLTVRAQRPTHAAGAMSAKSGRILVDITDQGPGIPHELRQKVFEPFFTTKPGGTGLGLAICRSIVKRYDGDIWIEQADDGGTSVKILLIAE